MHTSAHLTEALLEYTGTLIQPIEIRATPSGAHAFFVTLCPAGGSLREVHAQIPIAPGHDALRDAQALAQRINAAAKQGRNEIALQAPLSAHTLCVRQAQIVLWGQGGHPKSAAPAANDCAAQEPDLFGAAA